MHLRGLRVVPDSLLEFRTGSFLPSNNHQIPSKNFVRLRISPVEFERFRERPNGFADLLLGEQAVAQGIPTPRIVRVLFDISSQERIDLLESPRPAVVLEFPAALGAIQPTFSLPASPALSSPHPLP